MKLKYMMRIMVLMVSVSVWASCDTNYLDYNTKLKDGIYFTSDSLNYQFGMNKGEDFDYIINARVLGMPRDYDREFSVKINTEKTTAVEGLHYDVSKTFVVKAGQVNGQIPFVLHRYLDPEITEHPFTISLALEENEHFRLMVLWECKLEFSDTELPRPRWWSETYFGPYSQMLMMDIYHYYWQLEETHPSLFDRIVAEYGRELEKALSFPYQQEIAFIKYIITPAYEYYLEHPHEKVKLPDPATLY